MITFRLLGLDSLQAALRDQPDRVRAGLQDIVAKTAFSVAQRARATVPVDTGAYKSAIASSASGLTGDVYIASGVIRGRRPEIYWRFVEFGTVKKGARPILRMAAQDETTDVEARVEHLASDIERDLTSGVAV